MKEEKQPRVGSAVLVQCNGKFLLDVPEVLKEAGFL